MNKWEQLQLLKESGLVAVIRKPDLDKIIDIAGALIDGGTGALEVTVETRGAMEMIQKLKETYGEKALVGAGTVLDAQTAKAAIQAGADFIFSPTFDEETIKVTSSYGKISIPGALTPTEVFNAYKAGADLIKVFPANAVSLNYIKDLQGPLGHIPMMPTGGVSVENTGHFIKSGAVAVGAGGSLVDKQAISEGNYQKLTEIAQRFVTEIKKAREM